MTCFESLIQRFNKHPHEMEPPAINTLLNSTTHIKNEIHKKQLRIPLKIFESNPPT